MNTVKAAAPHEFDVHYHVVPDHPTDDGLGPYYALDAIYKSHDWGAEGKPTETMTFDGDRWALCFDYYQSGLDPWSAEEFTIETVREFQFYFVAMDDTYDDERADRSQRVRGGTITIRPRWPDMTSNGSPVDVPDLSPDGWVDVQVQGANIDFEKYADLARNVLGAFGFNSTLYLRDDRINETSTINDAALYVRLRRDESGPVHAADGPLARMNGLLRTDRSGFRAFKEDNRKLPGYNVSATVDDERAADIIRGHRYGFEAKHYYIREPNSYDPTEFGYHPKVEVAYQTNVTDSTVRWSEVEDVERELHETLINILEWAGLPTRGDPESGERVFFKDAYFDPREDVERSLRLVDCPLPDIADEQKQAVQRIWGEMCSSDRKVVEYLATDGGKVSPDDAAEATGLSYRTVRRVADRLEGLVEHTYGSLEFESLFARDELLERIRAAKEEWEDAVEDTVMTLADAGDDRERSLWSRFKQRFNVAVREDVDDARMLLRVRYEPDDERDLHRVLKEAANAHRQTFRRGLDGVTVEVAGTDRTISDARKWLQSFSPSVREAEERHNFSEEVRRKVEAVDWDAWAERERRRAATNGTT